MSKRINSNTYFVLILNQEAYKKNKKETKKPDMETELYTYDIVICIHTYLHT